MKKICIALITCVALIMVVTSCYKQDVNVLYSRDVLVKGDNPLARIEQLNNEITLIRKMVEGVFPDSVHYIVKENKAQKDTVGVKLTFRGKDVKGLSIAYPKSYHGPSVKEEGGYLYIDGHKTNVRVNIAGERGETGADGKTPILGAMKDPQASGDNMLYWTYKYASGETPKFILDNEGKKVPTTGAKGERGDSFIASIGAVQGDASKVKVVLQSGKTFVFDVSEDLFFSIVRDNITANAIASYSDNKLQFEDLGTEFDIPIKKSASLTTIEPGHIPAGWSVVKKDEQTLTVKTPGVLFENPVNRGLINLFALDGKGNALSQSILVDVKNKNYFAYFYNPLASVKTELPTSAANKLMLDQTKSYDLKIRMYDLVETDWNRHLDINRTISKQKDTNDANTLSFDDIEKHTTKFSVGDTDMAKYNGHEIKIQTFIGPKDKVEIDKAYSSGTPNERRVVSALDGSFRTFKTSDEIAKKYPSTPYPHIIPVERDLYVSEHIQKKKDISNIFLSRLKRATNHMVIKIYDLKKRMYIRDDFNFDPNEVAFRMTGAAPGCFYSGEQMGKAVDLVIEKNKGYVKYDTAQDLLTIDFYFFGTLTNDWDAYLYYGADVLTKNGTPKETKAFLKIDAGVELAKLPIGKDAVIFLGKKLSEEDSRFDKKYPHNCGIIVHSIEEGSINANYIVGAHITVSGPTHKTDIYKESSAGFERNNEVFIDLKATKEKGTDQATQDLLSNNGQEFTEVK